MTKVDYTSEVWKDVPNYEGLYCASTFGNIKSLRNNIVLKSAIAENGYLHVTFSVKGIIKTTNIHKIVANTFLGEHDSKLVVDHIDGNKLNNNLDNLQIISNRENITKGNLSKKRTSKYTGVSLMRGKLAKPWRVQIKYNNKVFYLGTFSNEKEAAKKYDRAWVKIPSGY